MSPRIITLTVNPALDIACSTDVVQHTHKIRTGDDHLDPGGGGINVARVLHELGGDTLAVLMAGGVTGALVEELLDEADVPRRTVPIRGRTRICFTVLERSTGLEYRFVPEGPSVTQRDWHAMLHALEEIDGGWIVASGSLEHGMPEDIYAWVARLARRRGQRFVLDTSGPALQTGPRRRHRAHQAESGRAGEAGRPRAAGPAEAGGRGAGAGPRRRGYGWWR